MDVAAEKIWTSGVMRKNKGMTAIVTTIELLRRYSRSSLRRMARTRLALMRRPGPPTVGGIDQPEIGVLEGVPTRLKKVLSSSQVRIATETTKRNPV